MAISYGQGGLAFGVTAGGNYGKGYGNGDEVTHRNSHVGDEHSQTNLKSGGATNIIGGQVLGNGITVDAAELNIASVQDTAKFKGEQQDMSAQVTVGYGFSASGSYSQSKTDADYAAVREQSGIMAGDKGYQIKVAGNTDLKGAMITSTELAGKNGNNQLVTGSLSSSDIKNHADYEASGFSIGGSVSREGSGGNYYRGQEFKNEASKSVGYGGDSGHANNITESGVYQGNIVITDEDAQRVKTGQSSANAINKVASNISLEQVKSFDALSNNFDKDKVQSEVGLQIEVTKEFDETRQGVKKEIYGYVDKTRAKAEDIRKNNFIDGLNGYNTQESLDLEKNADKWEKRAFYLDALLGGAYGWGNADVMKYVGAAVFTDPVRRAATAPEQIWIVKCNGDSLYCANNSYDGKKTRPIYDANGKIVDTTDVNYTGPVEIGDKRQIFDLADIAPGSKTGVITISNPGIMNPLGDALKNAVKQNNLEVTQEGIVVINNPKTTNLVSELLYAAYDKTNDLIGGRLPLTASEKANIKLYEYAKDNGIMLDLSNHSRGGLTASVALQNANRNGLTEIPIRESRFYGTATYVPDYANQLVTNGFTYTVDGNEYGSAAYSAVHYTDFVGRSPLIAFRSKYIVGGNKPTGGMNRPGFLGDLTF